MCLGERNFRESDGNNGIMRRPFNVFPLFDNLLEEVNEK